MAGLTSIPGQDYGFDAANNTQVLPQSGTATLILVAGGELKVSIDDAGIAEIVGGKSSNANDPKLPNLSEWEKQQTLERITVRGVAEGSTLLHARLPDGRDWIKPLRVVVRPNKTAYRQVDGTTAVGEGIAADVKGKTLHEVVVRVAQDQLASENRKAQSGADYGLAQGDWCGAFAWWCWEQAAKLKGGSNPFGGKDSLLSPQRAINWAATKPNFRIFNVTIGTAVQGFATPPSKIALLTPSEATPVLPGDIMIERHRTATYDVKDKATNTVKTVNRDGFTQWKHVAIVTSRITSPTQTFTTIEGNQGAPALASYTHDLSEKLTTYSVGDDKSRFAFVAYVE